MKKIIILLTCICPFFTMCQQIPIKGLVINPENEPIFGATITLKRTGNTTFSAEDGTFFFPATALSDTMLVSAVGYQPQLVPNNTRGLHTIQLVRNNNELAEVIVNSGYQKLPKERATGSFETVSNQLINRRISTNLLDRLEGVSSVYFDNRNSAQEPLSIRGRSTIFGNAAPLVVVDNVPYEADINNLNPNDVENITILKDAAAASIWGARAANGVIVVTTKKGRFNQKPVLQFNTNTTISSKPDLLYEPMLAAADYIQLEDFLFQNNHYNAALSNTITYPALSPVVEIRAAERAGRITSAQAQQQINELKQFDVRNDLLSHFYQQAVNTQQALSYTGGGSNINYAFSIGYDHNNAILKGNQNNRLTFRSQTNIKPVQWLNISLGVNATNSKSSVGNPASSLTIGGNPKIYPYSQLVAADGTPLPLAKDYRSTFIDTAGAGALLNWQYRPLQELNNADNTITVTEYRYNLNAQLKWLRYFTTDITYQLQQQQTRLQNHQNLETYNTRNLVNLYYNRVTGRFNIPKGSILDQSFATSNAHTVRLQNNADVNWGVNNNITALIGTEIRETRSESSSLRVYGYDPSLKTYNNVNFIDNFSIYNNIQNPRPIPNPGSFAQSTYRFFSLYSNAAYTKNNRYILSLSARKDASNIFGVTANQKGVPLWSAGLAWIISKESFYSSSWLPQLKFRLSYGTNGNIDNTIAAVTTIRYTTNAMYTMMPYAFVLNNPNPGLRWEKTNVLNFGIDFASKQNRIKGSIDLFAKNGTDLIGFSPIDPTTGIQNGGVYSYKGNVADMQGKGIELALTTINTTGKLLWSTTVLANYVSSKIKTYNIANSNGQSFINQGLGVSQVPGSYVYSIYAFRWAGLDPATGDPLGYTQQGTSKDYNAMVNVPVTDLAYKGSAVPLVFGSLMNTLQWKQFSLSANLMYKLGYWFMRPTVRYNDLFDGRNAHPDYLKRWQKPGDERATNVPSRIYPNLNINRDLFYGESEVHATRGDHIRLQDISCNWSFQPRSGKWINQVTVYTYLNNLGILWRANAHGIDPDYPGNGYPLPKTFALGCKITCK